MLPTKRKDDDLDSGDVSPYIDLRKNLVFRDAIKSFNEPQIQPQKCAVLLTKILYLLQQGESLSKDESIDLFFAVTKLFQSSDQHLRRLTYLMIKEIRVDSDSSLIVVSCLSKDMTSKIDLFRANAIRVLAKIMDSSMVGQMERFLKQSLVDKNSFIVASTLVGCEQLWSVSPDVIKRWVNEIQEALNIKAPMVQYHALALLHKIKQHDKLAINKVVSQLTKAPAASSAQSPFQQCLTIRIIANTLAASTQPNPDLQKYLVDCLQNRYMPMVQYEAARAISKLENMSAAHIKPAIDTLQEFLSSSVPVQRFAAVRALSDIVTRFPHLVAPCVVDLEHLISDNNRSIATLAITTLLKTGVEANVDRLMKSISGFMSDIADEFKIVLVDAIKQLALKFPAKYQTLLSFLSNCLREEGGFKYKRALVDAKIAIINEIREATELGLENFAEFIEDCEFPDLSISILYLLGEKGPKTSNPYKYIRYIFNRVILETASVRVAAVSSLAKFGVAIPGLAHQIMVLLRRCLNDNDDEVRDRALFYLNVLENDKHNPKNVLSIKSLPSLPSLEHSLNVYLQKQLTTQPFSLHKHFIQIAEEPEKDQKEQQKEQKAETPSAAAAAKAGNATATIGTAPAANPYVAALKAIPEIAALGTVFKSSAPVELTESETEYVVTCVKHIFPRHVVFQFNVTNNIEEQVMQNVRVEMESEDENWTEDFAVNEPEIRPQQAAGQPGTIFVAFNRPDNTYVSGSLSCTLHFTVKEFQDGQVGEGAGHEDEYQLEDIEVSEADFMKADDNLGLAEFKRIWETQFTPEQEMTKKYSLGLEGLPNAVNAVVDLLGMHALENTLQVPDGAKSHLTNLSGVFFGNVHVLANALFVSDAKFGVKLKLVIRSQSAAINGLLTAAIR